MPKFQVYKDVSGKTRFRLRANNNKIVAVGEAYQQYASCLKGIQSIKRNCGAPTEDLTIEGTPKLPNPKYQIYKDTVGEYRFNLKAANGEIIAKSEGYESKDGCLNGIEVVRHCADAEIEDPYALKLTEEVPVVATPEIDMPKVSAPEIEVPKVETPEIDVKTKEIPLITPTMPVVDEIDQGTGPFETILELYSVPENVAKGQQVPLQGRLYRTGTNRGISGAKIRIYERDRSLLGDDYLAFGSTAEDGTFNINWKARSLSWHKNSGNIYAKFKGNERAKASKSTIQSITIRQS